jgi:transposase
VGQEARSHPGPGRHFGADRGVVDRQILDHIAFLDASIDTLSTDIAQRIAPFEPALGLLCGIPGWGRSTAEVFIAETGGDMSVFPTAERLASWSGMAQGPMSRLANGGQWRR